VEQSQQRRGVTKEKNLIVSFFWILGGIIVLHNLAIIFAKLKRALLSINE